ncbi:uncharacterized protein BX663DRAFT_462268 [Cokeromyces recurvatus]|uniref:uncharacterized protein n=1 Tax=Cokeromyces recurvatus TaxID=90255 RepID=UPI002221169A|nr:uncharacterized protein BX663DRAFT_462268 [Cokeromyces recurvatus]KAI7898262.1 hypothetical protein BX663DRAFT_462268 [Cokeromyces recurvatus]
MSINKLSQNIIECIALYLNPRDIIELSSSSRRYYKLLLDNESFWERKTVHDFGDIFKLYQLFTNSTGLDLAGDLTKRFKQRPENWLSYYITKHSSIHEADDEVLLDQANKEYEDSRKYLTTIQDDMNYSILSQVASKMFWILDMFPSHAGCYYILGFILFIMNQLEDALDILDIGRMVDSEFEPFDELETEILSIMQGYNGDHKALPLLVNDNLSPELLNVLFEIFTKFDKDGDDCLSPEELDFFVFSTNGQHPPSSFIEQMGKRFGANEKGWLTKKGFLAFYLEQTLGDPSETKKDIRAHGYDCNLLKRRLSYNSKLRFIIYIHIDR